MELGALIAKKIKCEFKPLPNYLHFCKIIPGVLIHSSGVDEQ